MLTEKEWQTHGFRLAQDGVSDQDVKVRWREHLVAAVKAVYKCYKSSLHHLISRVDQDICSPDDLEFWIELWTVARLYWRISPGCSLSGAHYRAHCSPPDKKAEDPAPAQAPSLSNKAKRERDDEIRQEKNIGVGCSHQGQPPSKRCQCLSAVTKH